MFVQNEVRRNVATLAPNDSANAETVIKNTDVYEMTAVKAEKIELTALRSDDESICNTDGSSGPITTRPVPKQTVMFNRMINSAWFRIVGCTPLVKLTDKIYVKLETYSPTGSIKDRIIQFTVVNAIRNGQIKEDTILIEATSGNTGVALAACAAALKLRCQIFMPCNMSENRKKMMRNYGAELIEVEPSDFIGAVNKRDAVLESDNKYWSPCQFSNKHNILAHKTGTCVEVLSELPHDVKWDAFIHGSGTGGTMEAFCQFKQERGLNFTTMVVEPTEDAQTHGIQGIYDGADFLLNREKLDGVIKVSTADAKAESLDIARKYGILVGYSSGANLLAAKRYIKHVKPEGIVVTIFADRGERYM